MKALIRDFMTALNFLTIVPFRFQNADKGSLSRAMLFFPLVGFLIALAAWILTRPLAPLISNRLENLLLILFSLILSGGIHLDGFADFCDGFLGGGDSKEILRIMKDPHIGVWAAAGVVFLILIEWELLNLLSFRAQAFLLSLTAARWTQTALAYFLPYARREGGLGEGVARKVKAAALLGACSFLGIITFFIFPSGFGFAAILGVVCFAFFLGLLFKWRIGGITGDLLGAASQLTEVFVLALACFLGK